MTDELSYTAIDKINFDIIISILIQGQIEIIFKIGSEHFISKINKMNVDRPIIYKFKLMPFLNQEVLCSFAVDDDKYFFKSKINTESNNLFLFWPSDIFKLQQRNNFRFTIPQKVNYVCEITHINGYPKLISCQIDDISLGGLKLMCPIETKKDYTESEITLRILIKDYELTNVPCLVKKYVKPKESSRAYFGLKFLDKSVSFSTDLHGLLVYLDRVQRGKVLE